MIRKHVVQAIFRRNFVSYFSSPTGYVFIAVFVVLSSVLAFWFSDFFTSNLANLDMLNEWFPKLLLFFVPAVAMAIWAEERKQGTDELLLTLPARDSEIVVGKYLAALGIYSVGLAFSLTHVLVLLFLGSPDIGVMFGTYLGYWFLGGSLLAVAMTASLLTSSQTVAFILGFLFCIPPVFLGKAGVISGGRVEDWLESLGVDVAFDDLSRGMLSIRALFYFVSLAVLFLYLNLVILSQRRNDKTAMWGHFGIRWAAILMIGIVLGLFATRTGCRADLTSERLYSLSSQTRDILKKIDANRPVLIQAYISPEVPENFVESRQTLIGLLREYDAIGGDSVQLRLVDTEKFSAEARQAEEQFGIKANRIRRNEEGRYGSAEIYMGIAFICGAEEVVIPFLHRGLSVEYELTRSIGVVSGTRSRRIGIATTDAKLFGGLDYGSMSSNPEWQIITELKKQYQIAEVGLDSPINDPYDALIVAQVSSLTQPQMDNLMDYIRKGHAALLFDDPHPDFNPGLAPNEPKQGARPPMQFMPPPPAGNKGDLARFLGDLGIQFQSGAIVWDSFNPHPAFEEMPPEVLFIGKDRFNKSDSITSGLQEMVMVFGGEVSWRREVQVSFTPLLTTTRNAGAVPHSELFQRFFGPPMYNPNARYLPRGQELILAARVQGAIPAAPLPPPKEGGSPPPHPQAPGQVNVVFCADLDCISNNFFRIRQDAPEGLNFDNVTFVLNCVDVMAGDQSYVDLRKRRPKHRTLVRLEELRKDDDAKRRKETEDAEEKAKKELKEAQDRLDAKVEEIRKRTDIDERQKEIQLQTVQKAEQSKFESAKREIEDRKKAAIEKSVATMTLAERKTHRIVKILALVLPPIPPLGLVLYFLMRRLSAQGRVV